MRKDQLWETVVEGADYLPAVHRLAVPGGWLYQVEIKDEQRRRLRAWYPPIFVPGNKLMEGK